MHAGTFGESLYTIPATGDAAPELVYTAAKSHTLERPMMLPDGTIRVTPAVWRGQLYRVDLALAR